MDGKPLRSRFPYLIVLLILSTASFVVGNAVIDRPSVEAQTPGADELVPQRMGTCKIISLGVYADRIELQCQLDSGGVGEQAVVFVASLGSQVDSRQANRFLSLLTAAYALGRSPVIYWENMLGPGPSPCPVTSCRRLSGVVLQ